MLVLCRQRDQVIMLGDDVEITVVDIRGGKVRIGITAPRETPIHRKEVWEAIRRENRHAAAVPAPPGTPAAPSPRRRPARPGKAVTA